MKQKNTDSIDAALNRLKDGNTILIGGFGLSGIPEKLIDGVCERGLRDLTVVNNSSGAGQFGVARLLERGCVSKVIVSFPWCRESKIFKELYAAGKVDLEIVPQGILAERMRAAGAGLGGILSPSGVGPQLARAPGQRDAARRHRLRAQVRAGPVLWRAPCGRPPRSR